MAATNVCGESRILLHKTELSKVLTALLGRGYGLANIENLRRRPGYWAKGIHYFNPTPHESQKVPWVYDVNAILTKTGTGVKVTDLEVGYILENGCLPSEDSKLLLELGRQTLEKQLIDAKVKEPE